MALRLKQTQARSWKQAALKGALVVGASYLVLKTFPHLGSSVYGYLVGPKDNKPKKSGDKDKAEPAAEDLTPIELEADGEPSEPLGESAVNITHSQADIAEWSDANLKSWLGERSILHRMLLMITLFPLLSQFRTLLMNYNMALNFNFTQFLMRLLYYVRKYTIENR